MKIKKKKKTSSIYNNIDEFQILREKVGPNRLYTVWLHLDEV